MPVAAKIAFATAGATGGTGGSPMPPMASRRAFENLHVDLRRLSHAHDRIVVEIRLLHAPAAIVISPSAAALRREDHAAFELRADRARD